MASIKERLAEYPVLGWLLRVQERFGEVKGTALANGIALQAFLSLFPLLILAVAVVGFVAADDVTFADEVIDSLGIAADDQLAEDLRDAIDTAKENRGTTGAIGLATLLWSGLNVVVALQRAVDSTWQTLGTGLKDKLKAIGVVAGGGVILVGSLALSALINFLPGFFAPLSVLAGLAVDFALFLWLFWALGRVHVGWRALAPGAAFCAVGFEVLKLVGTVYVPKLVANSSALYGSLGIVVAILLWLAFFGRLVVYGSTVNVIEWESHHGTVQVPLEVPRVDTEVAVGANRSGAVVDRLDE
ncbi:YihY/virulence factor BrkB family protein [Acidimicrobiia bacterium EGI L10123]|uniref:YihY/virulence factor BrkB family protein n=1 Tax=Salinilacustrithrix flava TaxID=2957203 RepID=UPI003D7C3637|nr:YihY/virulence factor BrkB family protein [Acidimicrobiia bacterium EGI L10123]